jgi:nucleoside-diphosphate-sugar epimerase
MTRHLVVDLSSHGFGHAGMTCPVLNALRPHARNIKVTIRTAVPAALIAQRVDFDFDYVAKPDFGMVMAGTMSVLPAVYGDGQQRRDWLYVIDHCAAIRAVLERGRTGETYNIGGGSEKTNIEIVHTLCDILDADRPRKDGRSYRQQIEFIVDRPGHDRRYAMDAAKIASELGWTPSETFETGIRKTVRWYLDNPEWVERVMSGAYRDWLQKNYANR